MTAVTAVTAVPPSARAGEPWEQISDDEGIVVWKRSEPGTSFNAFRGKGPIRANIRTVLAAILDEKHRKEWMYGCVEDRVVGRTSSIAYAFYNRVSTPGPFISDRDVVADAKIDFLPAKRIVRYRAWNVTRSEVPEVDGVVRMPMMRVDVTLRAVDAATTEVVYEAVADVGGLLPAWLINLVSRSMPRDTIIALRGSIAKGTDAYQSQLKRVDAMYDWKRNGFP